MKVSVPIRTGRGLNSREHHMTRSRRVKAEIHAVRWLLNSHRPVEGKVEVVIRRVSPSAKGLDGDNLQGSLKAVRDAIAQWLGRDDADASIVWRYEQRRGKTGEWAVEIEAAPLVRKTACYVAGPMSGLPELNFPAFHAAAAQLRSAGFHVENPAEINADPTAGWVDCMRADIARLVTCDAICLLPNWQNSRGATLEHHIAHSLGMRIFAAHEVGQEKAAA